MVSEAVPPNILKSTVNGLSENIRGEIKATLNRILMELQAANKLKTFGSCKTCKHHLVQENGKRQCGLTMEWLTEADAEKICREHQLPANDS